MNVTARPRLFAAFLALALGAGISAPLAASAASAIPTGTQINGVLMTDLDSGKAQVGDGFSVRVTAPYPNGDASYANAVVRGHVASVRGAGQGRKAQMGLAFDSIVLPSGARAPLSGTVVNVQQKQKSAILQQAAGAGVGMIVGNILGKSILHTGLGGLAGAAGGFVYANNLKTNFTISKGSPIALQTTRYVPRPQARY